MNAAVGETVAIWGSHAGRTFELGEAQIVAKDDFRPLIALLRLLADGFEAFDRIAEMNDGSLGA